jgi:hypothetical protein
LVAALTVVESPIGQGDGGVDVLQLAFQVEQEGPMPAQKARPAVGLRLLMSVCVSRKSCHTPAPLSLSSANAVSNRSRSSVVIPLASLRTRTIAVAVYTAAPPLTTRIVTSPSFTLGEPNTGTI